MIDPVVDRMVVTYGAGCFKSLDLVLTRPSSQLKNITGRKYRDFPRMSSRYCSTMRVPSDFDACAVIECEFRIDDSGEY